MPQLVWLWLDLCILPKNVDSTRRFILCECMDTELQVATESAAVDKGRRWSDHD